MTGRFIDHDDKVPGPVLSAAFEWTSKKYQSMFKEVYSECTCWYCEAVRESHTTTVSRILQPSMHKSIDTHLSIIDSTAMENKKPMPHLSTHNVIDCPEDSKIAVAGRLHERKLNTMYERARQRAAKKGRELPEKRHEHPATAVVESVRPAHGPPQQPYYLPYAADTSITSE
ncbi:MAG: hypothetical protein Q9169_006560, partial [Polycauliona sp. 2 TL-2023]